MPILISLALSTVGLSVLTRLDRVKHRRRVPLTVGKLSRNRAAAKRARSDSAVPMSAAEADAARQQRVSVAATALIGTGSLFYAPMVVAGLPLLGYNYLHSLGIMRRLWLSKKQRAVVILDTLSVSFAVLTGFYFTASLMFTAFFTANRWTARTEREAQADFSRIFGELSDTAWLFKDGVEIETPLTDLAVGDVIVVHAGDMIPVDGEVQAGEGLVDQHLLTGESQPVEKGPGEPVLTSTLLISGKLHVLVQRRGDESITGQIAKTLEHAARFKQSMESRGDRIVEKGATHTMLASAIAVPFVGVTRAVALSYSGFGYQMRLAAPLMVLNYLRIASRNGILIKDGRALDTLTRIDTVVFDKTGTLTEETPAVEGLVTCAGESERGLLLSAASAEQRQRHPIARAILKRAVDDGLSLLPVVQSEYAIGHGLKSTLKSRPGEPEFRRVVLIGSRRFIDSRNIVVPEHIEALQAHASERGHSVVYVATGEGMLLGAIELRPTLRPYARETIVDLHRLGITSYIISGDQEWPTHSLAAELGVDHYFAEILPTEKAELVARLQQVGRKVCFIGDGINDSVALQKADVAVSLHGAATIAQDTAEVLLMTPELMHLPYLIRISRELAGRMDGNEFMNNAFGVTCVSGVLLLGISLSGAILLYSSGLLASLSNAMLPLLKHPGRRNCQN